MGLVVVLIAAVSVNLMANYLSDEDGLPGPVEEGLAYFRGDKSFENGGPPCIGCHSLSLIGVNGTDLGPDLSSAFVEAPSWSEPLPDFEADETGLEDYLRQPSTTTMRLLWQSKPLTQYEVGVLVDLLKYASRRG